jgi:cytoskeletal protein CcmA (bactofilin family)
MAIWKDNTAPRPAPAPAPSTQDTKPMDTTYKPEPVASPASNSAYESPRTRSESLIAADITIEGKIEGAGSVRIAGKFKGDVNVQGDLTIESGAKLIGAVRAEKVIVAGELEGNVESAALINVLATGAVIGDVKAGSVNIATGARMRGQVNFGWDDSKPAKATVAKASFNNGASDSAPN